MSLNKENPIIDEFGGDVFQWMRGFYYVALKGSVSLAAEEMGRSQPTVSRQILNLEESLGIKLFDRSGSKMRLTSSGRIVLDYAVRNFDLIHEMQDKLRKESEELEGRICIAATPGLIIYYLSTFINDFKKKFPKVHFEIRGGMEDMVIQLVESGWADFGVLYTNDIDNKFIIRNLFDVHFSLISPEDNRFSISSNPLIEHWANLPLVGYPVTSTIRRVLEENLKKYGFEPNYSVIMDHYESVKRCVALGMGVSFILDYAMTEEERSGLFVVPIYDFPKLNVGMIFRKRKYINSSIKEFVSSMGTAV